MKNIKLYLMAILLLFSLILAKCFSGTDNQTVASQEENEEIEANTGKVYGKFNNIKIDGSAPSLSEPEVDNANVTVSSNDVTVVVDSDTY